MILSAGRLELGDWIKGFGMDSERSIAHGF